MLKHFSIGLRGIAALIVTFLTLTTVLAKQETNIMTLRHLYQAAVAERGDSINAAMAAAEAILEKSPRHALAEAYKGSLLTMMGGEAFLPWNKLRYVNSGLDLMDGAAAALDGADRESESTAEILMVCGFTNSRLPRMFKRAAVAKQQIDALIAHPAFSSLEPQLQAQALAIAASNAKSEGNASASDELMARASSKDPIVARKVFNERS